MSPSDPQKDLDRGDQEAVERRASTSEEFPSNVTRSTQDLTIGGSEKDPDSRTHPSAEGRHPESSPSERHSPQPSPEGTEGRSSSEQAGVSQERALESGEESPG